MLLLLTATSQCWREALGEVSMEVLFFWILLSMLVHQYPTQLILVCLKGLSFHSGFIPKEDSIGHETHFRLKAYLLTMSNYITLSSIFSGFAQTLLDGLLGKQNEMSQSDDHRRSYVLKQHFFFLELLTTITVCTSIMVIQFAYQNEWNYNSIFQSGFSLLTIMFSFWSQRSWMALQQLKFQHLRESNSFVPEN